MYSASPGLYATLNHFRLIFLLYTPEMGSVLPSGGNADPSRYPRKYDKLLTLI